MDPNLSALVRYQSIIDDWPTFCSALSRPLPTCLWANPLRVTPDQLAGILAADGIPCEPLAWYPGAFKLAPDARPGRHWSYLAGLCQPQEEVSLLPVILLDPQPGERVLDLCAAPGNKTAQIAVHMHNTGTIVANDINAGRMRAARNALERLGLVNVTTTVCNGTNYPKAAGRFDRVLVDVPCTCEGTSRKEPGVLARIDSGAALKKSGLQRALLRKAVQLCKPGGRIVYATCTYAPEENELVVNAMLEEFGDTLRLLPARIEGFVASAGLTAWRDQPLHSDLWLAMRVWPHHNDSGGFFVAVLEKAGGGDSSHQESDTGEHLESKNSEESKTIVLDSQALLSKKTMSGVPLQTAAQIFGDAPVDDSLREEVLGRFGLAANHDFVMYQQGRRRAYLVNPGHTPPAAPEPDSVGLLLLKTGIKYPKLSTAGAMLLGGQATRNYVDLTPSQMKAYLNRHEIHVSAVQATKCTGQGYVLVKYQGFVLGVGLYLPREAGGRVRSMFPKGWSPEKG